MNNTSIVVCGQKYDIGARVVLWDEPSGFNGYDTSTVTTKTTNRKTGKVTTNVVKGKRYGVRSILKPNPSLEQLQKMVTQIFLHHTGVQSAKTTFDVLHKERGISVQLILGEDGVLYQTMDIKEKSWQAGSNNAISVGIEICSRADARNFPDDYDEYHQQKFGLQPHKKRSDYVQKMWMLGYEYTDQQYDTLIRLAMVLKEVFPNTAGGIKYPVDFPRNAQGVVIESVLPNPLQHVGFTCHYHATSGKWDPVSFDHERFLLGVFNGNPQQSSTFIDFTNIKNRQIALTNMGFDLGAIDGAWGDKSANALMLFKKSCGLNVDKVWDGKVEFLLDAKLKGFNNV